jgi:hypothetical protein
MDIGTSIAGSGVTGGIIAALYIGYKCCYRKKFKSKCCGAEMNVEADSAVTVSEETPQPQPQQPPPTPQRTPQLSAAKSPLEPPPLDV